MFSRRLMSRMRPEAVTLMTELAELWSAISSGVSPDAKVSGIAPAFDRPRTNSAARPQQRDLSFMGVSISRCGSGCLDQVDGVERETGRQPLRGAGRAAHHVDLQRVGAGHEGAGG